MRVRHRLCVAALLMSAVTGCGTGTGEAGDGTPTPTSPSRSDSAAPESTTLPKPTVPPDRGTTTLRGQLVEPVEAGCVVLGTDDGPYVLLGVPAKVGRLDPGTALVVRGSVTRSTMTTCQQGTPFKVDTVTPS